MKAVSKTYMSHSGHFSPLVRVNVDELGQGQERQEEAAWDTRKANGQVAKHSR